MIYTDPKTEAPHSHFSELEQRASNLGARMAAVGFSADDNPYELKDDRYEAWWRGFSWCRRLKDTSWRLNSVK